MEKDTSGGVLWIGGVRLYKLTNNFIRIIMIVTFVTN